MKKTLFVFIVFSFVAISSNIIGQDCTPTIVIPLPAINNDGGHNIVFNPNDGLIYHVSGISDANESMESYNPTTMGIASISGGPFLSMAITGLVWYEPLGVFIATEHSGPIAPASPRIFSITTAGTFAILGNVPTERLVKQGISSSRRNRYIRRKTRSCRR